VSAGQHRHWEGAPCGYRVKTAAGTGQRHPLPPRQRVWKARTARGPPASPLGCRCREAGHDLLRPHGDRGTAEYSGVLNRQPATRTVWRWPARL